jgi:hypothetical protein
VEKGTAEKRVMKPAEFAALAENDPVGKKGR